jgi:hypothetical protein
MIFLKLHCFDVDTLRQIRPVADRSYLKIRELMEQADPGTQQQWQQSWSHILHLGDRSSLPSNINAYS